MKQLLCTLLFLPLGVVGHGQSDPPKVPATIEIAGMKLKITEDARREIQKDVNALRASDKYFQIKLDRVNLYFPVIERVLKEEGVPDDLKYLSIQESALISDAVSSSDAVGYWQFKDFTAREVGLRVDNKIDERKNIVSATHGAARYFKRNNMFFNNWMYAVNAYMTGPGGVQRYVNKANFGKSQMTIDKHTHWYVLRFIAHCIAFRDEIGKPHSEGLQLMEYTNGANKDLRQIAQKFNTDEALVKDYNKWLRQTKIPDDKLYTVIVPVVGKVPKIRDESPMIASQDKEEPTVKYPAIITSSILNKKAVEVEINGLRAVFAASGDNLKALAARTGLPEDKLEKYNDLRPKETLKAGQIYYTQNKRNRSPIRYHIAQYDESMWDISQKYGIKLKKLAKKNRMEISDPVKPGRLMWLRKTRPADTEVVYHDVPKPVVKPKPVIAKTEQEKTEEKTERVSVTERQEETSIPVVAENAPLERVVLFKYHPVKEGETLSAIAAFYEIDITKILGWNEMAAGSEVRPGQNLRLKTDREILPVPVRKPAAKADADTPTEPSPETSTANVHTVLAGESLWSISRKYSVTVEDLQSWNSLGPNAPINPGQTLIIQSQKSVKTSGESVAESTTNTPEKTGVNPHEVQPGESLWIIAQKYGITVENIQTWNKLNINEPISPGQKLIVTAEDHSPKSEEVPTKDATGTPEDIKSLHEVQPGESLWAIAQKYNVTVEQLLKWNGLGTNDPISIGQQLRLEETTTEKVLEYISFTVKAGDSLYKIAKRFGMTVEELMKLNNLESSSLSIGDQLKVKKQ